MINNFNKVYICIHISTESFNFTELTVWHYKFILPKAKIKLILDIIVPWQANVLIKISKCENRFPLGIIPNILLPMLYHAKIYILVYLLKWKIDLTW